MKWGEFYEFLRKEGERLCSDHCVRSVAEDKSSIGLLGFMTSMLESDREQALAGANISNEEGETYWSWKPWICLY